MRTRFLFVVVASCLLSTTLGRKEEGEKEKKLPPTTAEMTRNLFQLIIEERESGEADPKKWISHAKEVSKWGDDTTDQVYEKMKQECDDETKETKQWINGGFSFDILTRG